MLNYTNYIESVFRLHIEECGNVAYFFKVQSFCIRSGGRPFGYPFS